MRFANEAAATASRVLDKCASEVNPYAPWRWQCIVENGARLPVTASLEEGFLHLACRPETTRRKERELERALRVNDTLAGGVKLALNSSSRGLHLQTEIEVRDERQLLDRFQSALEGFHQGVGLLNSLDCDLRGARDAERHETIYATKLGELLRESSWVCKERGANDYSAELDSTSAPLAKIRMTEEGLDLRVELLRAHVAAEVSRRALAVFLLRMSGGLRMARAYAATAEEQECFGFRVWLPSAPDGEEIDHALGALSMAHRMCAREMSVLLDEAAARCYMAAREFSTNNQPY